MEEEEECKSVDFSGKNITRISGVHGECVCSLILARNSISSLANIPKNDALALFDVSWNQIESIGDASFANIPNLVHLNLSSNLISKIQNLSPLNSLQELHIDNNRIETFENLEQLKFLSKLSLSHNRIHTLFLKSPFQALTELDLSYNMITKFIQASFFPVLSKLNMDHCFITDFSSLKGLRCLSYLSLSGNRICDDIPLELPNITFLDVSYNNITSLTAFSLLSNIITLDISFNPIGNNSLNMDAVFEKLQELSLRGTRINDLKQIARLFPSIKKIDLRDTYGITKENIIEFVSTSKSLQCIDVRGLFFKNSVFNSFDQFQTNCPSEFRDYVDFRKKVLQEVNQFPFIFDGIKAETKDEDYFIKEKNIVTPINKKQKSKLARLISENNDLRKELNISIIDISISDLNNSEIDEMIEKLSQENNKFVQMISSRKDFQDKLELAMKILRDIESMKSKIEKRNKEEIQTPNVTEKTIDSYIAKLIKKYKKIRSQYEQLLQFSNNELLSKYEHKIMQKARNAMLPDEPTILEHGSREFYLVHKWLSLKMMKGFKIKSLVKINSFREFIEKSDQFKWMQLVFSLTSNDQSCIVSDHCGFFESGKNSFLLCALDSGKQNVCYQNITRIEDASFHSKSKFNTMLFYLNGQHAIFVRDNTRIVPLYSIMLSVSA